MGCFLLLLATAIFLYVYNNQKASARALRIQEAERDYRSSLAALKQNPTNADLREETLRRGRSYSNLTRDNQGVTMFDEVALMNDINAACAAAGYLQARSERPEKPPVEERLAQLKQLRDDNLISQEEYDQARANIIKAL